MNVLKFFIYLVIFTLSLNLVYSFNVCGVDIEEPWFTTKSSNGDNILIIDNNGNIYALGEDHSQSNSDTIESLEIDNMHFNSQTSKYNSLNQDLSSISGTNGLIIKSSSGSNIAYLSDSSISISGKAAIQGEQAACLPDGNYCSGSNLENRNYFCDITGVMAGSCTHEVLNNENCNNHDGWYCDPGNIRIYKDFNCAGSSPFALCKTISTSGSFDCDSQDTSWVCKDSNTRGKKDYYCSGGSCKYTWTSLSNCASDEICSGGSCESINSPTCNDGIQNQGETDIDCGGPCSECVSLPSPSCNDGIRNQGETDIDCGGPCSECTYATCTLAGLTLNEGESHKFWRENTVYYFCAGTLSQVRTCQSDGTFDGSDAYKYKKCIDANVRYWKAGKDYVTSKLTSIPDCSGSISYPKPIGSSCSQDEANDFIKVCYNGFDNFRRQHEYLGERCFVEHYYAIISN